MRARFDPGTGAIALILVACAAAPLFFRFFITVDGPMHVLHASVLEQHWTTPRYVADGVAYNTGYLDVQLGDFVLIALLRVLSPEAGHAAYAALVSIALVFAAMAVVRAMHVRVTASLLWLAPVIFSFLLVMGFLHFMLGTAVALAGNALWLRMENDPQRRYAVLLLALIACWCTHRGAPVLLAALAGLHLIMGLATSMPQPGRSVKCARVIAAVVLAALIVLAAGIALQVLHGNARVAPIHPKLNEGWHVLRPFLLLDRGAEAWAVIGLGALLAIVLVAAVTIRSRAGSRPLPHDVLWVAAMLLIIAPYLHSDAKSRLLFVMERCHWLALLLLVLWIATVCAAGNGPWKRIGTTIALLALMVHGWRLWHTERAMADRRHAHILTMEATAALYPGKAVVPVLAEKHWLLQHLGAFAAIRYDGVFFWTKDHLRMAMQVPPIRPVKKYFQRASSDRWWLPEHQRSGQPPDITHLLFIGNDTTERGLWLRPWKNMIERRYEVILDNGYCTVYDVRPGVGR